MSRSNPTALRLGMTGMINGRRYKVVGRVVLSMVADDGETYYWNEFNMADESGTTATLVYEETGIGPEWKWFTLFEPRKPLTVAEAAAKRVGDTVEFEGRQIPVELVDESRVVYIEGQAPEDVEVGDVARYFNANPGGGKMWVASWTGEDIEFYLGKTLGRKHVEAAFGLPRQRREAAGSGFWAFSIDAARQVGWSTWFWVAILVAYFGVMIFENYEPPARVLPPPEMKAAPTFRLPARARANLDGKSVEVAARSVSECLLTRARFKQHEYLLRDEAGAESLLWNGWAGHASVWVLLREIEMPKKFDALTAAKLRNGSKVKIDGREFAVTELMLGRLSEIDGASAATHWPSKELCGFVARAGDEWLVCRWSAGGLRCYLGRAIPSPTVMVAFGSQRS
ncbi:MAG: DUF4178 domain-containing protein [Candidatus Didemnitutus sp.]|nr:DUF4178 domain-containing protein [Candidatus Didemnitutus sp.]